MEGECKSKRNWLSNYFKANPGALFIIAFQVILTAAAVLWVLGNSSTANNLAIYALYALVIGVVIQAAVAFREEKSRTSTRDHADNAESS